MCKRTVSMVYCSKPLYYNFIKPHEGLNGYTPAHFANIYLDLKDKKWENLLKQSFEYHHGKDKI